MLDIDGTWAFRVMRHRCAAIMSQLQVTAILRSIFPTFILVSSFVKKAVLMKWFWALVRFCICKWNETNVVKYISLYEVDGWKMLENDIFTHYPKIYPNFTKRSGLGIPIPLPIPKMFGYTHTHTHIQSKFSTFNICTTNSIKRYHVVQLVLSWTSHITTEFTQPARGSGP